MISGGRLVSILILAALAVLGVIGAGFIPRIAKKRELVAAASEAARPPGVRVGKVELAASLSELELPCDLQAMIESPINARVEGYISRRLVDIGSKVNKGDLLAELETPELDQQIRQAKATISQHLASLKQLEAKLSEAKASLRLAKVTSDRWRKLASEGVVSQQDADDKVSQHEVRVAEVEAAEASIAAEREAMSAAEANLERLGQMKSFSRLNAPFAGIVTWRNPDVGTLISPGAGGRDLFKISDISTIRVFVGIPQSHVPYVKPGVPAVLTVDDLPGQSFPGSVSNIANALDISTRTMLAVIKIPNPHGVLKPGMYSRVRFKLPVSPSALRVPGDAVVARNDGPAVALVDGENRVHFRKIEVARDNGTEVEVKSGVSKGDTVVISPSDEIRENTVVEPKPDRKAK